MTFGMNNTDGVHMLKRRRTGFFEDTKQRNLHGQGGVEGVLEVFHVGMTFELRFERRVGIY